MTKRSAVSRKSNVPCDFGLSLRDSLLIVFEELCFNWICSALATSMQTAFVYFCSCTMHCESIVATESWTCRS